MLLVDEYNLLSSENLLNLLDKVKNINVKIWEEASKRYQFNLKINKNGDLRKLVNLLGKDVFIDESIDTQRYCFKSGILIKREMYNLLQNTIKNNIAISLKKLNLSKTKDYAPVVYNPNTIYGSINLKVKTDHLKVQVITDEYVSEIPPIGCSINGLPFFEDKKPDELQTSGWWIEGTSVKFFINTFKGNNVLKNLKLKIYYYKG